MNYITKDGSFIAIEKDDIEQYFRDNNIIGEVVSDIFCTEKDYICESLEDVDDLMSYSEETKIGTDGSIILEFVSGNNISIFISGPAILCYNTSISSDTKEQSTRCFQLDVLFKEIIGKKIVSVNVVGGNDDILFPNYCEYKFPEYKDGLSEVFINFEDGSKLHLHSVMDFYYVEYTDASDNYYEVPYATLLKGIDIEYE